MAFPVFPPSLLSPVSSHRLHPPSVAALHTTQTHASVRTHPRTHIHTHTHTHRLPCFAATQGVKDTANFWGKHHNNGRYFVDQRDREVERNIKPDCFYESGMKHRLLQSRFGQRWLWSLPSRLRQPASSDQMRNHKRWGGINMQLPWKCEGFFLFPEWRRLSKIKPDGVAPCWTAAHHSGPLSGTSLSASNLPRLFGLTGLHGPSIRIQFETPNYLVPQT